MRVMLEECTHEVKVTRLGNGWAVRVYANGEVNQERTVYSRQDIGPAARDMLRMEDKCGNHSAYARAARKRMSKSTNFGGNIV